MAKSTEREPDSPRYSLNWARARRGTAKFYNDRVEHGDRIVKFEDIISAKKYSFGTLFGFMTGTVLTLETVDGLVSFGLNGWCKCLDHLPFDIEDQGRQNFSMTRGSIVYRLLMLAVIFYWIWRFFFKGGT